MARYVSFRDFDWLLLLFVFIICGLGVYEIHSATEHTKFAGAHIKQLYWIAGGVAVMFAVSLLNYHTLLEQVHWMYIAATRSEEHTSELQSRVDISYAVFCLI